MPRIPRSLTRVSPLAASPQRKQAVTRSISDQARVVRLPVHLHEAMGKVRRAEQQLWDELGAMPSPQAVADRCGLSYSKVRARLGTDGWMLCAAMRCPACPFKPPLTPLLTPLLPPLPPKQLMALYKAFRAPTSRDGGPLGGDASDESKAPGEQWVEEMVEEVRRRRGAAAAVL